MHLKLDFNSWIKTLLHKCVPFYHYLLKKIPKGGFSKKIKERNKHLRPKKPKNLRPAEINSYNNSSLDRQVQ